MKTIPALLRTSLAVACVIAAAACARPEPPTPPNVILITFDTLRADHLGCYGYERDTSPRLDAFADQATRYSRSMATSPWTVPTHASLFTGKAPFQHGAHAYPSQPGAATNTGILVDRHRTLAEMFREEGYATAAFMSNVAYLGPTWQLTRGFSKRHLERTYGKDLNREIETWVSINREKPFFLFVNYLDTHRPYNVAPRPGWLPEPAIDDGGERLDLLIAAVMPDQQDAPQELVAQVVDQYDTAITHVDEAFGQLIDMLRQLDLYDNTIIVATSDHGEYFGEHRLVEHSKDIYQEAIWAPLLIKGRFQEEASVEDIPTSSMDVPGLILQELDDEVAARHADDFPNLPGNHPLVSQIYYTRPKDLHHAIWGHRFDRVRTAVFDWPHKLIHSTDGRHELFDLEADPRELQNLIDDEPAVAHRLMESLRSYVGRDDASRETGDRPTLTNEEIDRMRSLGYTGD